MGICEEYSDKLSGEEFREHPDNKKKIQVRCKNIKCNNSKEKEGWFIPSHKQIKDRIKDIEEENNEIFFFCSKSCREDYVPKKSLSEKEWKIQVLKNDGYKCQLCDIRTGIDVYNIFPVDEFPHLSLEPEFGVTLCKFHRFRMKSLERLRKFKESQLTKEKK